MLNGAMTDLCSWRSHATPAPQWVIPTEDEWYKEAYYKGGGLNAGYWAFPTRTNSSPINTLPDTGNHANFDDAFSGREITDTPIRRII